MSTRTGRAADDPTPHVRADWMGYRWSAWMPLLAAHPLAIAQLPSPPGMYRLRRRELPGRLEYLGWADHGVRETIERLSRQAHMPVEPFDDPRHPARMLWLLRRQGVVIEVSGTAASAEHLDGEQEVAALRRLLLQAPKL
jgi:hypothetical protein